MPVGGASRKGLQSDDEDDFFKPSANSTLAKIFGITKNSPPKGRTPAGTSAGSTSSGGKVSDRYGASSFRYVPPSPEPEVESQSTQVATANAAAAEWNLVQASVVTAYKLVNNDNTAQGKLGIALLSSGTDFRVLLYRTKTDALATLNITKSTKLFIKQDYLQFQSDDECFWSVLFENVADRDRLLSVVQKACSVDQEKLPPVRPVPASRSVPIVEEPESDVDRSKASLISRMARVGQPILPQDKPAASTTEVSDSSDTDATGRIETIPRHRRTGSGGGKIHPVTIGMQMVPSTALSTAIAGQNMLQTAADVNFNMFMAENRMQGTEVRMNLSKLESKLDRVLDKIDLLNVAGSSSADGKSLLDKDEDILELEEKVLQLKKENHSLKAKIRTLEADASSIRENSSAKENLLEAEEKCRELGEKVVLLEKELKTSQDKSNEARVLVDSKIQEISIKDEIIESKTKEILVLEGQLLVAQSKFKETTDANLMLENQMENLQKSTKVLEKQLEDQKAQESSNKSMLDGLVKDIMNNCYQRMSERIDDGNVLKIIGQTIKQETKAALERRQPK